MKKSYIKTLIVSLAITLVIFLLLVFGVLFFCALLNFISVGRFTFGYWEMLLAAATAMMAAGVFGAAYLASRQLAEVCESRYLEAANTIFAALNSSENIAARRLLYEKLPDEPDDAAKVIRKLSREEKDAVKKVLNSLDQVAFLMQEKWIPKEKMMPWMHPMIFKSWKKLKNIVAYEQSQRNESYYYDNVVELAQNCLGWREAHGYANDIEWVDFKDTI